MSLTAGVGETIPVRAGQSRVATDTRGHVAAMLEQTPTLRTRLCVRCWRSSDSADRRQIPA